MDASDELQGAKLEAFQKGLASIKKMDSKRDQFDFLFAMRRNVEIENDPVFFEIIEQIDSMLMGHGLVLFVMGGHDLSDPKIMSYCAHCVDVLIQEISYIRYCGGDEDRIFEIWINKINEMEEELHRDGLPNFVKRGGEND